MFHNITEKAKGVLHGSSASGSAGQGCCPSTAGGAHVLTVQNYIEKCLNARDFSNYATYFSPNVVGYGLRLNADVNVVGLNDLMAHDRCLFTQTFPDGHMTIKSISSDTNGQVFVRYEFTGTMRGNFPSGEGAPTNKQGRMCGISSFCLGPDNLIKEIYNVSDHYQMLLALGLIQPIGSGLGTSGTQTSSQLGAKPFSQTTSSGVTGQPSTSVSSSTTVPSNVMDAQARML